MDKKKLIGTIIGVVAFAALIAGATYAWLTFSANITNDSYNGKAMNFLVSYVNGNAIIAEPPSVKNSSATPSNTTALTVQASRTNASAPGNLTIYLVTTSLTSKIYTDGLLHYGYCIGTCSSFTGTGSIKASSADSENKIAVLTNTALNTSATSYNFYFWLDGDANDGSYGGETYSGYIMAKATQTS